MPSTRRFLRSLLLAGTLAGAALAQEVRPRGPVELSFEIYGLEQGLSSLSTTDLIEDRAGNVWVATQEGVERFDGDRFRIYGRGQGLPSPVVFALAQDQEGSIWAATLKGLARLGGGRFSAVALPGARAGEPVQALALDGDGRLIAGAAGGVFRCSLLGCERIFELPGNEVVTAIAFERTAGDLWFAGTFGLVRWHGKELERYGRQEGLPSLATRALLADRYGNLWIRQAGGLVRLDTADGSIHAEPGLPQATGPAALLVDHRGVLWATSDDGLFSFVQGRWQRIGTAQGLPGDDISSVMEDHEGSLWIGTAHAGLARWLGRDRFVAWTRRTGLPNDVVWAITRTSDGRLAVGTQAGLVVASPDELTLSVYDRPHGLPGDDVLSLAADDAGGLWIGLIEGALAHLDRDGHVVDVGSRQKFPDDLSINAISLGPGSDVWLATSDGLWHGAGSAAQILFAPASVPGEGTASPRPQPAETFSDLLRDRSGVLWAAGCYGLARLENGTWRRVTTADGLLDDYVTSVAEAGDGALWIGYRDAHGVSEMKWTGGKPQFRQFSRSNGLRHDQVAFVRTDALGRIWVGTTRGISVRVGDRFANFGRGDGMFSASLCANAFHADPDGTAWIGTPRGAVAARLSSEDLATRPAPAARILSFSLGSIRYDPAATPVVPYSARNLGVDFGARTFRAAKELEFRYRLLGVDAEPVVTAQHSVRYGALPAGKYAFEVAARRGGGDWGKPARFGFEVRPPWWQTMSARLFAALLAVLIGLALDRWRTRRGRARRATLEGAVAERTRELAASRAELKRKNEELGQLVLTDPLTGLRNRRFAWEFFATEVARVDTEWSAATAGAAPEARLVFFLLDIDGFKSINDLHGHEVGDQILIEAAERVRHATRISDVAVRWGGEEFLIVARDLPREEWAGFAARLRQAVAQPPYEPSPVIGAISCTASLGYVAYPFDVANGTGWQESLRLADQALYAVKQTGRDAALGVEPGRNWKRAVPHDILAAQAAGTLDLHWGRTRTSR